MKNNLISKLSSSVSPWLQNSGVDSDILISCRLRLARNIKGYPFSTSITKEQKESILRETEKVVEQLNIGKTLHFIRLDDLETFEKMLLFERHLISKELIGRAGSGVIISEDESISIIVNEEDHFRIQILSGLFKPFVLWEGLSMIDDQLNKFFPFAFDEELGYLTCCITNVGCGFRITLLVHLPAINLSRELESFLKNIKVKGVNIRGVFGEGSHPIGSFYQISNQSSFGQSEGEIIEDMGQFLDEIIKFERKLRQQIIKEAKVTLEDRIYRTYGVLKYAKQISWEESLELLSIIRLGIFTEFISNISVDLFNELFIFTQPHHLQTYYKEKLPPNELNVKRAQFFREKLAHILD
ncbi:MAG: ATP--guanido phosphotransferase [Planctomycetota bacterium]